MLLDAGNVLPFVLVRCTSPHMFLAITLALSIQGSHTIPLRPHLLAMCYIPTQRHLPDGYDYMGKRYLVMDFSSVSPSITCVMYTPPRDRQTAKHKQKAESAEEWIKNEDSITETMTRPNGVYTRYVSTSLPESEQDDA